MSNASAPASSPTHGPAWPAGGPPSALHASGDGCARRPRVDLVEQLAGGSSLVALEVHLDHRQAGVEPPELEASEAELDRPPPRRASTSRRAFGAARRAPAATKAATPRLRTSSATGFPTGCAMGVLQHRARRGRSGRPGCGRAPSPRTAAATARRSVGRRRPPPTPVAAGAIASSGCPRFCWCSPHAPSMSAVSGPSASGWAWRTRSSHDGASSGRARSRSARSASPPPTPDPSRRPSRRARAATGARHAIAIGGALGHAHRRAERGPQDLSDAVRVADRHRVAQRAARRRRAPRVPATPDRAPTRSLDAARATPAAPAGTRRTGGGSGTSALDRRAATTNRLAAIKRSRTRRRVVDGR